MAMQQEIQYSEDDGAITIPIVETFSDGDQSTWPTDPKYGMPDDSTYRQKLAKLWLEKTGAYDEGTRYMLDRLPDGYALLDRPRGSNNDIRDRFLWGHPVGQYFYSSKQFFPHFYYLMTGGAEPCLCNLCEKLAKRQKEVVGSARRGRPPGSRNIARPSGSFGTPAPDTPGTPSVVRPVGRPPGRPAGRPVGRPPTKPVGRPVGRPPGRPSGRPARFSEPPVVDREGTPDVFKMAIMNLRRHGKLDESITEQDSMDWRAERSKLDECLETYSMQPSYVPRVGEVVLWALDFEGELAWNPEENSIQIYSPSQSQWLGAPQWRAGIVGQAPEEDAVLQDLVDTAPKQWGVNYSGFRVETFPDPLSTDKSYSLHYKYIHLKCIKPFNAYEVFLQGIAREALHPSIEYAMTIMSSFSLLDKFHFKGVWPDATIFCRGIFIGAELLVVGDAVRLKPISHNTSTTTTPEDQPTPNPVTDIMVIDEIRLELTNCDSFQKSPQLAERYDIRLRGQVYTPDHRRSYAGTSGMRIPQPMNPDEVVNTFHSVGMGGHGNWYRLWSGASVSVSQNMVLGRCYEPDALQLLFGSLALGLDLPGILKAREYSRQADERIPADRDWFWGDFRTQTLAIDSLNGEDVGHYSETRDARMWRANLHVIDGTASPADLRDSKIRGDVGRPSTKARSSFAEVRKLSTLVSTGLGATDVSNPVSSAEESGMRGGGDDEESDSEELEDFTTSIEQLRGGTEETEEGDYVPDSGAEGGKRPRHHLE